jgi:hypothetical protein
MQPNYNIPCWISILSRQLRGGFGLLAAASACRQRLPTQQKCDYLR